MNLRRLLGQVVSCSGCGRTFREWRRHPCRRCGDTRRTIARSLTDQVVPSDRLS